MNPKELQYIPISYELKPKRVASIVLIDGTELKTPDDCRAAFGAGSWLAEYLTDILKGELPR